MTRLSFSVVQADLGVVQISRPGVLPAKPRKHEGFCIFEPYLQPYRTRSRFPYSRSTFATVAQSMCFGLQMEW